MVAFFIKTRSYFTSWEIIGVEGVWYPHIIRWGLGHSQARTCVPGRDPLRRRGLRRCVLDQARKRLFGMARDTHLMARMTGRIQAHLVSAFSVYLGPSSPRPRYMWEVNYCDSDDKSKRGIGTRKARSYSQ